jgi:hypothetical protein
VQAGYRQLVRLSLGRANARTNEPAPVVAVFRPQLQTDRPPGLVSLQAGEVAGCQLWGSNSPRRVMECAAMRDSTSRSQATGSTPDRLQEATKRRNPANASSCRPQDRHPRASAC